MINEKIIDLMLHDYGTNLARQLYIKTGLPIYTIYDANDPISSWGREYFQYFIKVDDTYYLHAKGLFTEDEMKQFWQIYNDPDLYYSARIIPKQPERGDIYTGYKDIDDEIDRTGGGLNIQPFVKEYADFLIETYNL